MPYKKEVLFITSRSDHGGGPKHVLELCQELTGINIHIAAPDNDYYSGNFKKVASTFLPIPHRQFSIISYLKLLFFCKAKGIQTIHSHGKGAGVYSRLLALFGLDVVHTFHGVHQAAGFKGVVDTAMERVFRHLTRHYIFVSNSEREIAFQRGICHQVFSTIPNGIKGDKLSTLPLPADQKVLGTISRLDPHKNNLELIHFLKEMPDYTLYIAGDGEQRTALQGQAPTNVHFLGAISDPQELLSLIHTYVSASKGEGLPYSLLEAVCAKRHIVISNVTGHRDIAPDECLYQLGSFKSFQEKVQSARSIPFDDQYTIAHMVEQTKRILAN